MARKQAIRKPKGAKAANGATVGYEAELWQMADALRGGMDAAEYKHVVLGLIFLKYISDAFEEHRAKLEAEQGQGADPEDPDEYRAHNIFWVPPEIRTRPEQKSRAGAFVRRDVGAGVTALPEPGHRGGTGHRRADRPGPRHARGRAEGLGPPGSLRTSWPSTTR